MILHVFGTGFKQTPVEIREKFSINKADYISVKSALSGITGLADLVVISTCNRVELYFTSPFQIHNKSDILTPLMEFLGIKTVENPESYFYFYSGEEAFRHLFCVTSALDSLVIGEPQITGQVKEGYRTAEEAGKLSGFMNRTFEESFRIAKLIRQKTEIGKMAVSVSFVVVKLAQKIFGTLSDKRILIVGSGEMAEQSIIYLQRQGVSQINICNRTFENAVGLAGKYKLSIVHFDKLMDFVGNADMVITSTGAAKPIITEEMVKKAMRNRKKGTLFIVDIAMPRDVEPEVNKLDNLFLYNIDDLQEIVNENMGNRVKESEKASQLIDDELRTFLNKLKFQEAAPLIKALKTKFENYSLETVIAPISSKKDFTEEQKDTVSLFTHRLVRKILHAHVENIRNMYEEGKDPGQYLNDIFNLELPGDEDNQTQYRVIYLNQAKNNTKE